MQTAILLHAPLSPGVTVPWADGLLQALPYARRLQLERADATARIASLAGLALALTGAGRVANRVPHVADFRFADGAKPRLEHGPFFSVSHTPERVACAVSAVVDVGLDIETVPSRAGPEMLRKLSRWTATEATLKAAGLGLRRVREVVLEAPALAAILHGGRYVLHEAALTPHTIGHVASAELLEVRAAPVALDGPEVSAAVQRALGLSPQR